MPKFRRRGAHSASTDSSLTIYFASDLHGSTRCWKKFLAAPGFYGADVIIVGGDVTGKFLVPIVEQEGGKWRARYQGSDRNLADLNEVVELEQMAEDAGAYPVRLTLAELEVLQNDQGARDALLDNARAERLEMWGMLADERLCGVAARCFVSGGNDDDPSFDAVLGAHPSIVVPEGQVIEVAEGLEMLSLGYANRTPWNCPRDISEDELELKIEALVPQVSTMERCIFNLHVPPHDTGLDTALTLDAELTPVRAPSGDFVTAPVGSFAVRAAIERHQPLLGLHGHIHESQGIQRLGKTVVCNPGSEYQEGLLHGVLVKWNRLTNRLTPQIVIG